ncbi:MAG: hypothetical protein SXQ77_05025 [Halobacteria archaeon]|nr:hypothetical protein [Halobacteria archaeon]
MQEQTHSRYEVKNVDKIRGRIARILGYCNVDGNLHNPRKFEKKALRSKWVCPECGKVAGKVDYRTAMDLQWVLTGEPGDIEKKKRRVEEMVEEVEDMEEKEGRGEDETREESA